MRRRHIPMLTVLAFSLIAISILVIGAWEIFPKALSKTLSNTTQDQVSAAELSAAIDALRQDSAKLTRSASFDQRFRKLSEKAQKNGSVPVIVKVRAAFRPEGYMTGAAEGLAQRKVIEEAQDRLLAGLRYEPSSLRRYKDIPYVAVSTDSYGLEQLKSSADVLDLVGNISMKLATAESLPQIKAGRAWRAGYSGAGKTIVILDSGVDKTHPALSNKIVAEACFSTGTIPGYESLCPGNAPSSTAEDSGKDCDKAELSGVGGCGHGTHIAGIAAGRSGVAKDANIISIQVMSYVTGGECGFGTCLRSQTTDVMDALQHVYDNLRNSHSIASVNISLVTDITGMYPDSCDDGDGAPLKAKIDQLRSVGIPTVIAAGNDGFTNALGYPACISTSVSVGAVGDGSGSAAADAVWQDSNGADYLSLLAPGDAITSAIPGGGTTSASGTSQAAAHVSGAWAILKQMAPAMSVDEALNRLYTNGRPITDARNGLQFRRIQVDEALGVLVPEDMWEALYYNNPNLEGIPVAIRNEGDGFIDRYFNAGASPVEGVGAENYSIRWIRTPTLDQEGTYRFSVTGDDGVRLYVDGQLMINEWKNQAATTYNVDTHLDAGNHEIRLEYYQATGTAQARLNWGIVSPLCSQDVPTIRWKGEYFNNMNLAGSAVAVKDEGGSDSLNFNWVGPPSTGCNLTVFADYFSARWTRTVNFAAGTYRFSVTGDDGVRLYVDGDLKIDKWFLQGATTYTADVTLSADNHEVKLEYFEGGGPGVALLSWGLLPAPPSSLVASAASTSQINLNWADNSGNEDGFKIERWNGSSYAQINTVGANVTTYADLGLATSTTYYYRVRAYNSIGSSGSSNEASATTFACSYAISPEGAGFPWYGGLGTITVSAAAGCPWSASSDSSWIIVFDTSGVGNGSVEYRVQNYNVTDGFRSGTITIGGQLFWIGQEGPPPGCTTKCCTCLSASSQRAALDTSATDGNPRGLTARYFDNTTLSGQPALQRTDAIINFDWAGARPDAALPADRFSVRWSGQLAAPSSEAYTFYLYSNGGARLWVNNRPVIDRWGPPFETLPRSAPVEMKAGEKVDVRLEYYDAEGEALIQLLWSSVSTPKQIIPLRNLYPEATTNKSEPTDTDKQMGQQIGRLPPPGSDAGPKATRPQPSEWLAIPLGRAGLATEAPLMMLTALMSSAGLRVAENAEATRRFSAYAPRSP
jgi:subtilisin